jgi:hypothetical protein
MRPPLSIRGGLLAVPILLSACSSLKMPALQDARVLPAGGFAFSGEIASGFGDHKALLVGAHRADSVLMDAWRDDSLARFDNLSLTLIPMAGLGFAYGAGGGWELGFGADIAPLGEDSWTVDGYAKKRVYADGDGSFVSLFARASFGSAAGYLDFQDRLGFWRHYRFVTNTFGADLQVLYLGRLARKLGYYLNAGPSAGTFAYALQGREGQPNRDGDIPVYGFRAHAGMVFELRRFELAWEAGWHVFNYGMTPSLGVKAVFKSDWRR